TAGAKLLGGDGTRATDRAQLVERLADRVDCHFRLHTRLQYARARPDAKVERCSGTIGISLVLPQVHVDPADELPTKDDVQHDERVIVGGLPRGADVTDS